MIRDTLLRIGAEYTDAQQQSFAKHATAGFLREDAGPAIGFALTVKGLEIQGSAGQGNWADVPWIGIFDPRVTDSATRGYYVVYLFDADMQSVTLSMNQGTTAVRDEFGPGAIDELTRRAALIRARVPEFRTHFSPEPINLHSRHSLPRGYEAGHAFGITYTLTDLPDEVTLRRHLNDIAALYLNLTSRGGLDTLEEIPADEAEAEITEIPERHRYKLHRKLDRNPKASRAAKRLHGYVCQGCGFDFEKVYGPSGRQFIEAHHLKPIADIPEGQTVSLDPRTDFAVLCSNCHSMMHRKEGPRTISALNNLGHVPRLKAALDDFG